jgi:threonine synthase
MSVAGIAGSPVQTVRLRCVSCDRRHPADLLYACPRCRGILEVDHGAEPPTDAYFYDSATTLGEGATPLLRAKPATLHAEFAGALFLKDETRNPSGSFKDRLVAHAMADAIRRGCRGVVCASSGNAGAAVACYAAKAGIEARIVCPEDTPRGKLTQILAYGASLLRVPGDYGQSYDVALRIAADEGVANLTTTFLNPYGVDALRLVGREIARDLGRVPDWVLIPTGSGPLVKGVVQGFEDLGGGIARIGAVQAEGCAPIVAAFVAGSDAVTAWETPRTFASGIRDPLRGYEQEGAYTLGLVRKTRGVAIGVSDDRIREAMRSLAAGEGVLAEPTGAAPLAAARILHEQGLIEAGATVVLMVTGHGFNDLEAWAN